MIRILTVGQLPKIAGGSYTTGVTNVVYELSKQEVEGIEMFVYSTNMSSETARRNSNLKCTYYGYKKDLLGLFWGMIKNPFDTYRAWKLYKKTNTVSPLHIEFIKHNLKRVIKKVKPDLIHAHNCMDAVYYANKHFKIPVLYTLHGLMWCGKDVDDEQERKWKLASQLLLPLSEHYSTLNERALEKMLTLGVERKDVTIIPNGVDTKKFYFSYEKRMETRRSLSIYDDTVVFVTVGTVIDRKGQLQFLKIAEQLGLKYQYWIIGGGPDYERIECYVTSKGLESSVNMLGYIKDVDIYKYLSAADFYVLGSSVEGQSLAEIEAFATGLRTIVNKLVADTVVGNIDDEYHYHVLDFEMPNLSLIKKWICSPYKERTTQSNYDWSVIAKMYGNLYKQIVAES